MSSSGLQGPHTPKKGNGAGAVANAIEVEHIVKKFGDFVAVDDVSFNVKEGEIFGLLGPNGAGKSTLIRMMTTLIPITAGAARIAGFDVKTDPDDARRVIGVIPQALTSDIDLTVEENMSIYAKLYDVPATRRKQAINELLELVDLTKWRSAQTKTLSGGMRRRLEIARGLVHSPKIFFLDEPTTGLDPVSRVAVWEMLTNIKKQRQLIENAPADWEQRLHKLVAVTSVQHEGAGMYRILTGDGSRTTTELVEAAAHAGVGVKSLSVQNTTLDDVFVHYTGRQLRDELVKAYGFVMPSRPGMQP